MQSLFISIAVAPLIIGAYAYVVYPAILWLCTRRGRESAFQMEPREWPTVTITVPVYNSADRIGHTLEKLLQIDYPRERLQILVLSDASTDGTEDIVRGFQREGVTLWRSPERRGKTAAENAAVGLANGEIIVNVDATIEVPRHSLKPLICAFSDPSVGVASGRDVSVSVNENGAGGEGGYVGYEMWVRDLETRAGSIVGASGCFFAIRRRVHASPLPAELSWDFGSSLVARRMGLRSVSVAAATCVVQGATEVRTELRRKSRTMARGLRTLFYFRGLLNPFRYGTFALMLASHKLLRWLPYLLAPLSIAALAVLALSSTVATGLLLTLIFVAAAGLFGVAREGEVWKPVALASFGVAAFCAGLLAWYDALRGERMIIWAPTPRPNTSVT